MKTVAVFDAKNRFSELIAQVEHGEEITITRHGAPVARLVAINVLATPQPQPQQQARVLQAMLELRDLGEGAALGVDPKQAITLGRD
jgi:prevent-host-death family protein